MELTDKPECFGTREFSAINKICKNCEYFDGCKQEFIKLCERLNIEIPDFDKIINTKKDREKLSTAAKTITKELSGKNLEILEAKAKVDKLFKKYPELLMKHH